MVVAVIAGQPSGARCETGQDSVFNLKKDETVQFFRTAAHFLTESEEWVAPIYAWTYEPESSRVRMTAFKAVLEKKFDLKLSGQHEDLFRQRVNLLIADNERGKRLVVRIAGQVHTLPATDPRGHSQHVIRLDAAEVEKHRVGNLLPFTVLTRQGDDRLFTGEVLLITRHGYSVISDIDDTVKISGVSDTGTLMAHTFFLPFSAVSKMPELYQDFAHHDIPVHFVSSSPWQLYSPLNNFLLDKGFPPASFSLKTVRFRDRSLLNLFKSGEVTKPVAIEAILEKFPERKFIFIGDSGEQDPEVYDRIARHHPEQVSAVFIRNVTGQSRLDPRYAGMLANLGPERFFVFDDPDEIRSVLAGMGVLTTEEVR